MPTFNWGGEREKDDGLVSMYEVRFPLNGEIKLSCQTSLESSPEALDGWAGQLVYDFRKL